LLLCVSNQQQWFVVMSGTVEEVIFVHALGKLASGYL